MVFVGLVTACRRATRPTRRSPFLANATTEGVVRNPSAFAITLGSPPSMTDTHELVVPRSMPMTLPMYSAFRAPGRTGVHRSGARRRSLLFGFDEAGSADLDLDLADPRFVGLGNPDLEHAVLEAGFDLIAAHPGAEGERALERAVD